MAYPPTIDRLTENLRNKFSTESIFDDEVADKLYTSTPTIQDSFLEMSYSLDEEASAYYYHEPRHHDWFNVHEERDSPDQKKNLKVVNFKVDTESTIIKTSSESKNQPKNNDSESDSDDEYDREGKKKIPKPPPLPSSIQKLPLSKFFFEKSESYKKHAPLNTEIEEERPKPPHTTEQKKNYKSALTSALRTDPDEELLLDGSMSISLPPQFHHGRVQQLKLKIHVSKEQKPIKLFVSELTPISEVIRTVLRQYRLEKRKPPLQHLTSRAYELRIAEDDGEPDEDYPSLNPNMEIGKIGEERFALCPNPSYKEIKPPIIVEPSAPNKSNQGTGQTSAYGAVTNNQNLGSHGFPKRSLSVQNFRSTQTDRDRDRGKGGERAKPREKLTVTGTVTQKNPADAPSASSISKNEIHRGIVKIYFPEIGYIIIDLSSYSNTNYYSSSQQNHFNIDNMNVNMKDYYHNLLTKMNANNPNNNYKGYNNPQNVNTQTVNNQTNNQNANVNNSENVNNKTSNQNSNNTNNNSKNQNNQASQNQGTNNNPNAGNVAGGGTNVNLNISNNTQNTSNNQTNTSTNASNTNTSNVSNTSNNTNPSSNAASNSSSSSSSGGSGSGILSNTIHNLSITFEQLIELIHTKRQLSRTPENYFLTPLDSSVPIPPHLTVSSLSPTRQFVFHEKPRPEQEKDKEQEKVREERRRAMTRSKRGQEFLLTHIGIKSYDVFKLSTFGRQERVITIEKERISTVNPALKTTIMKQMGSKGFCYDISDVEKIMQREDKRTHFYLQFKGEKRTEYEAKNLVEAEEIVAKIEYLVSQREKQLESSS